MKYIAVKKKKVNDLLSKFSDLKLISHEDKIIKLIDHEVGLPICDAQMSDKSIKSGCIVIDGISYKIFKRKDHPLEFPKKPCIVMKNSVKELLNKLNIWREELDKEIPKSWVKYGDMVIFDSKSFTDSIWKVPGDELWTAVCAALKVRRLGRRNRIKPDGFRTPTVEILYGDNGWVTARDGGIRYSWDVSLCMFSPGNGTERYRIANMNCAGEVVVDLYAGIGYFTLPYLVMAKAEFVHACEWNPAAVKALSHNLKENKVFHKCCIHEGDNRKVCPQNVADRVNMGLIPTSRPGIEVACKALKSLTGGVLHLHENVSSYRGKSNTGSLNLSPLSSKLFDHSPPSKLFPNSTCQKCQSILLTFPKTVVNYIEVSLMDVDESGNQQKFSVGFSLEGSNGKPEWYIASPLVWKKMEWFLQALHFSHIICAFLSSFHKCPWKVILENVHHVKSYAPHVDHLVFDIKCFPLM